MLGHEYTGMVWDQDITLATVQKYIQNPSTKHKGKDSSQEGGN